MCRSLRSNLSPPNCIIHIDFSENFSCKFSSEIQAVHLGGSHSQVTLHTAVLYIDDIENAIPFGAISNSRRHDPYAIWCYLQPLFDYMKESHLEIETIHFFSDGPTSQYRQKCNFYLFCTKLFDLATLGI